MRLRYIMVHIARSGGYAQYHQRGLDDGCCRHSFLQAEFVAGLVRDGRMHLVARGQGDGNFGVSWLFHQCCDSAGKTIAGRQGQDDLGIDDPGITAATLPRNWLRALIFINTPRALGLKSSLSRERATAVGS